MGLPSHNQQPNLFEDLSHMGFCEHIREHELGVAFDHLDDAWLHKRPKMMQLYPEKFLSVIQVLGIGQGNMQWYCFHEHDNGLLMQWGEQAGQTYQRRSNPLRGIKIRML